LYGKSTFQQLLLTGLNELVCERAPCVTSRSCDQTLTQSKMATTEVSVGKKCSA